MSHKITIICDSCDSQFMIDETMDMPPYWLGVRLAVADGDGLVSSHERELISVNCLEQVTYEKSLPSNKDFFHIV